MKKVSIKELIGRDLYVATRDSSSVMLTPLDCFISEIGCLLVDVEIEEPKEKKRGRPKK